MKTQSSLKPERFQLVQNFDGSDSWIIIEIVNTMTFNIKCGPYLTKEEAESDLRILKCEQE